MRVSGRLPAVLVSLMVSVSVLTACSSAPQMSPDTIVDAVNGGMLAIPGPDGALPPSPGASGTASPGPEEAPNSSTLPVLAMDDARTRASAIVSMSLARAETEGLTQVSAVTGSSSTYVFDPTAAEPRAAKRDAAGILSTLTNLNLLLPWLARSDWDSGLTAYSFNGKGQLVATNAEGMAIFTVSGEVIVSAALVSSTQSSQIVTLTYGLDAPGVALLVAAKASETPPSPKPRPAPSPSASVSPKPTSSPTSSPSPDPTASSNSNATPSPTPSGSDPAPA